MPGRPRVHRSTSFFSGFCGLVAMSAVCACSGGASVFVPPATTVEAATDDASSPTGDDATPDDTSIIDLPDGAAQLEASSSDKTSHPVDAAAPTPSPYLLLWLRADVAVSTEGGHVASWGDGSGHANDARQMDENLRPTLEPTWRGGQPAILFDGVSAFLDLPSVFNDFTEGLTLFVVGDVADNANCPSFIHFSNDAESDDISLHLQPDNSFEYEVADQSLRSKLDAAPPKQPLMLGVVHEPSHQLQIFSAAAYAALGTMLLPANVLRAMNQIGRSSYSQCGLLSGHIAEIILYRRPLSADEKTSIEGYLRAKWSL
jgi:hypothetical protein